MKMIEITEDKTEELGNLTEKVLHYAGKIMTCLESMKGEGMEWRNRDGMQMRRNRRDDWDDDEDMQMRRSSRSGRYM